MFAPVITASEYSPEYREVNAKILRIILEEIVPIVYDAEHENFEFRTEIAGIKKVAAPWGVRITKRHDGEKKPHFIMEVGQGQYHRYGSSRPDGHYYLQDESSGYQIEYVNRWGYSRCVDYYFDEDGAAPERKGYWMVEVWLPFKPDKKIEDTIYKISCAYKKVLDEVLLNHEIICMDGGTTTRYLPTNI